MERVCTRGGSELSTPVLRVIDGWRYRAVEKVVLGASCRWVKVVYYVVDGSSERSGVEAYSGENYLGKDLGRSWSRNYGEGPYPKWMVPIVQGLIEEWNKVDWNKMGEGNNV